MRDYGWIKKWLLPFEAFNYLDNPTTALPVAVRAVEKTELLWQPS